VSSKKLLSERGRSLSRGPYLLRLNEHANRRNRRRPTAVISDESKPHHFRRNPHMTAQIRPDASTKSNGRCTCRRTDIESRDGRRTRSPTIRHPDVCKRHDTRVVRSYYFQPTSKMREAEFHVGINAQRRAGVIIHISYPAVPAFCEDSEISAVLWF
jgi:hypothetical protein